MVPARLRIGLSKRATWSLLTLTWSAPSGTAADISRTWLVGNQPTPRQLDLYQRALAEISYNADLLEPGRSFREISEKSFRQDEEFVAHRYTCLSHGVGMTDEYPKIAYPVGLAKLTATTARLRADTVLTVESFVGVGSGRSGRETRRHVSRHSQRPRADSPTSPLRMC